MMKTILLISAILLINGCVNKDGLTPETKKEIAKLLDISEPQIECRYPKLPIDKIPPKQKFKKGTSLEKAFVLEARTNTYLRKICEKNNKIHATVNRRYKK